MATRVGIKPRARRAGVVGLRAGRCLIVAGVLRTGTHGPAGLRSGLESQVGSATVLSGSLQAAGRGG